MYQNRPNLKSIARVLSSLRPSKIICGKAPVAMRHGVREMLRPAEQVESQAGKMRIKAELEC